MGYKDESTLRELYHEKGMSSHEVADIFDVSPDTILYHMDKHGISRRKAPDKRHPTTRIDPDGYIRVEHRDGESRKTLRIHRLLAVSIFGFDAVAEKEIHHKNGVPWDNRPENIEIIDPSKHRSEHNRRRNMERNNDGTFERLVSFERTEEQSGKASHTSDD